jgi:hypothetical protein
LKNFNFLLLGLSENIVTDDGVLCIGGGVKGTKNLQILDLSSCQLSSVGVMRVCIVSS